MGVPQALLAAAAELLDASSQIPWLPMSLVPLQFATFF